MASPSDALLGEEAEFKDLPPGPMLLDKAEVYVEQLGSPRESHEDNTWRKWVWGVVHVYASNHWHPLKHDYGRSSHYWPTTIFEGLIGFFIVLNVITSVLDTALWEITTHVETYNIWDEYVSASELISTIFFICEYLLRIWACVEEPKFKEAGLFWGRVKWAKQPLALIDLMNVAVFAADYIYFYRFFFVSSYDLHKEDATGHEKHQGIRMFRICSILRFERRVKGIHRMAYILRDVYAELYMAMYLIAVVVLVSAAIIFKLEHGANEDEFETIPAAIYWSISTITTVGYGDVSAKTALGKLVACCLELVGIVICALPTGIITSGLFEVGSLHYAVSTAHTVLM
jgi:voltage-gated potassium channel